MSAEFDIVIVGGGLFGLTTAETLAKGQYRDKAGRILVIDRYEKCPAPDAASSDINKIVRGGDYIDEVYADLSVQALNKWVNDPDWKDHFHQSGCLSINTGADERGNKQMAAIAEILQALYDSGKLAAASRRITSQADYEKVMNATEHNIKPKMPEQAILNTCSGWADASGSMHALHKRVKALGVTFAAGIVARLIEQDGDIKGAEMQDGRMFTAKRITILAAGSWSGTILPELRSILKATGQSLATFQLTPEEVERYRDCISSHAIGYTNMLASLASDAETVSTPRTKHYGGTLAENAPQASLDELREQFRKCAWPDLADKPFEGSRLCWYSDTVDEDWLIGYHKTYKSLFLATGGSGHAFKFAPVMGEVIVAGVEGRLSEEMKRTWAHDKVRVFNSRYQGTAMQGPLPVAEMVEAAGAIKMTA